MIRPAESADADGIAAIYNYYVANTVVTFEEEQCTAQQMAARVRETLALDLPWLVAENDGGQVIGYAYASRWNGRCSYRYSLEITVYLSHLVMAQGWGSRLYDALFGELRKRPVHVLIAGIALPNAASIALHEKFGMRKVAHFSEVGHKLGQWHDVGYWQVMRDDAQSSSSDRMDGT